MARRTVVSGSSFDSAAAELRLPPPTHGKNWSETLVKANRRLKKQLFNKSLVFSSSLLVERTQMYAHSSNLSLILSAAGYQRNCRAHIELLQRAKELQSASRLSCDLRTRNREESGTRCTLLVTDEPIVPGQSLSSLCQYSLLSTYEQIQVFFFCGGSE